MRLLVAWALDVEENAKLQLRVRMLTIQPTDRDRYQSLLGLFLAALLD